MSSFVTRALRASLILPQGTFPGTNSNTLVLPQPGTPIGFRMSAKLAGAGNYTNTCDLQVWGMRQVDMNAVTVLFGYAGNVQTINAAALLILEAQAEGGGFLQIFEGQMYEAQPDYRGVPDVCLSVNANTAQGRQYLAAPPSSFAGAVNVVTLAAQLAGQMGFPFENNGVTGTLNTPYFPGTLMDQFRQLAEAARFDYYFDPKSTLIICPRNQPRKNQSAVVLSPTSGLSAYVTLNRFGIEFDALFQPAFELGSPIEIRNSETPGANGLWFVYNFTHELDAVKPGGRWFSHLQCMRSPTVIS
jgi:hypothetical protein